MGKRYSNPKQPKPKQSLSIYQDLGLDESSPEEIAYYHSRVWLYTELAEVRASLHKVQLRKDLSTQSFSYAEILETQSAATHGVGWSGFSCIKTRPRSMS